MDLHRCRVVLVRPEVAGNLGATARAMRNFGLSDLCLVAPVARPDDRQARQLSTHGEGILDKANIVPDLSAALADCVLVVGTSARTGGPFRGQSVGTPRQIAPEIVGSMAHGPVALVFGPEPSGLTNKEVTRCHFLMHIPTDLTYGALNLAQAVAICLYEIRCAWLSSCENAVFDSVSVPFADFERALVHLRTALQDIHFLYGETADSLMHGLRHLIGRAKPTPMEIGILHGLARQIEWIAKQTAGSRKKD
ncbi:MAG: RNA methyltransferase [Gemmataceae bacterium]